MNEDGTPVPGAQVSIVRTDGNVGAVTVEVTLNGSTSIPVAFSDRQISTNVGLGDWVVSNGLVGGDTVNLTLSLASGAPAGAALGSPTAAVVTVVDNSAPGTFSFSASSSSVREDGGAVQLGVIRTGGTGGSVSLIVTPSEIPGGAQAGVDFSAAPIEVMFEDGNSNRFVSIPVMNDYLVEPNKVFQVNLSLTNAPAGAEIGTPSQAQVIINTVLTVEAAEASRSYGAPNPPLTGSILGLGTNEEQSLVSGNLTVTTVADADSPVGTYSIVPGGWTSTNYPIDFVNGTLTVTPAPLTLTADNATRPYGQTNPVFTGTISGIQNGDDITAAYSCSATATSPPGTYAIVPAALAPEGVLGNYQVTLVNGTLTVLPAPATVSLGGTVWYYPDQLSGQPAFGQRCGGSERYGERGF